MGIQINIPLLKSTYNALCTLIISDYSVFVNMHKFQI